MAATTPTTAEWVVGLGCPLRQCMILQRYAALVLNVVLPLLVLRQLERRARLRFRLHEAEAALGALRAAAAAGGGGSEDEEWAEVEARHLASRAAALCAKLAAEVAKTPLAWTLELYLISTTVWATVCYWNMRHAV